MTIITQRLSPIIEPLPNNEQSSNQAQSRSDNSANELRQVLEAISESQTEASDQLVVQIRKLSSMTVRQIVTQRMLSKLFSLESVTQRFLVEYLVEERLRQQQLSPQEFGDIIDGFLDPQDKKGYEAMAEIEDEYELSQELRLTNRLQ
jgi:phytoene dehydrogenase-like protein